MHFKNKSLLSHKKLKKTQQRCAYKKTKFKYPEVWVHYKSLNTAQIIVQSLIWLVETSQDEICHGT